MLFLQIRDEFVETDRFSEYNGKPAISIRVMSVGNQSELDISATVEQFVQDKSATMPSGISLATWADISYYLKGRLDMMVKNLVIGALLVFLSLALFLRLKLRTARNPTSSSSWAMTSACGTSVPITAA